MAIPSKCPLCGEGPDRQTVVTRHVYHGKPDQAFFRCRGCDVCYLHPGLSLDEQHRFYTEEFSSFMTSRAGAAAGWEQPEHHVRANEWMVARRMKYLRPRLPSGGRVLEVGCSSGFMLYPLQDLGFECVGVEPAGLFGDFVRSKGINCYESLEQLQAASEVRDGFDLVMHAYVLEHMSDPREFLATQLDLVKEGGQLILEIPNSADALLTIYDIPQFERFYWIVAHHWYFSEPSLEYLLKSFGYDYEILLDQRYDLSNHMVWARDGKPGGMGRFTSQFGEDLEHQYRQALVRSRHCDTLIGVIRKNQRAA